MKTIAVISLLFGMCGMVHANGIKVGKYEVMRSTEISGTISNFQVATGSVYLHGISVTSGSDTTSSFQYRNSSTTQTSGSAYTSALANSLINAIPSTSTVYTIDCCTSGNFIYIGDWLAEGLNVTTTGNSHLRIFWDWIGNIPAGQEKKGLRR